MKELQESELSAPFKMPVDPVGSGATDYYSVIETPMDLGTITDRLRSGFYSRLVRTRNQASLEARVLKAKRAIEVGGKVVAKARATLSRADAASPSSSSSPVTAAHFDASLVDFARELRTVVVELNHLAATAERCKSEFLRVHKAAQPPKRLMDQWLKQVRSPAPALLRPSLSLSSR